MTHPESRRLSAHQAAEPRAFYLNKRDVSRCPDCNGTAFVVIPGKGVRRCEHPNLVEGEVKEG